MGLGVHDALQVYSSMWDAARGIVSQRGVQGLYSGLGVTLVEIIPYAALQFGLYDALNGLVNDARARSLPQLASTSSSGALDERHTPHASRSTASSSKETRVQHFACGLLAGLFAKLASHPLDVAKKRYQVAGLQRSLRYVRLLDCSTHGCHL
jgi:solute carrier family 25 thiamine pyrophosphate transporter 19